MKATFTILAAVTLILTFGLAYAGDFAPVIGERSFPVDLGLQLSKNAAMSHDVMIGDRWASGAAAGGVSALPAAADIYTGEDLPVIGKTTLDDLGIQLFKGAFMVHDAVIGDKSARGMAAGGVTAERSITDVRRSGDLGPGGLTLPY